MPLVDTSVFVDHFRGFGPASNFFRSLSDRQDVIFSAITEAEIIAGKQCGDSSVKDRILHFLHKWKKIEVTNQIAVLAGDISRENKIAIPDAIIAATAIINKSYVITKNVKDFSRVHNLKVEEPY